MGTVLQFRKSTVAASNLAQGMDNGKQTDVPLLKWLAAASPRPWPGFSPSSCHMGFVVDQMALGQVSLRVLFGFPCQLSFHCLFHNLSSVADTIGPLVAGVPYGLKSYPTPPQENNK
jgi:hypothetical protein